MKKKQQLLSTG